MTLKECSEMVARSKEYCVTVREPPQQKEIFYEYYMKMKERGISSLFSFFRVYKVSLLSDDEYSKAMKEKSFWTYLTEVFKEDKNRLEIYEIYEDDYDCEYIYPDIVLQGIEQLIKKNEYKRSDIYIMLNKSVSRGTKKLRWDRFVSIMYYFYCSKIEVENICFFYYTEGVRRKICVKQEDGTLRKIDFVEKQR
jgi:hypothetical protein